MDGFVEGLLANYTCVAGGRVQRIIARSEALVGVGRPVLGVRGDPRRVVAKTARILVGNERYCWAVHAVLIAHE